MYVPAQSLRYYLKLFLTEESSTIQYNLFVFESRLVTSSKRSLIIYDVIFGTQPQNNTNHSLIWCQQSEHQGETSFKFNPQRSEI